MDESPVTPPTTRRVLLTSFIVDSFCLVINVIISTVTGSAVMIVEALEGFAGLSAVIMLWAANKRSNQRATKLHPFGYGREISYWSTVAAFVIVLAVGVTSI